MVSRTQRLLVVAGLLVSAVFLWLAFSRLNPAALWAQIRQADPIAILAGVVAFLVSNWLISLRWQFLLHNIRPIRLRSLFELVNIGYMGNNVYPFRSGEVLRVWLLQRNEDVPIALGATTAVVERVFDGLVLLTFVVGTLLLLPDIASPEIQQILAVGAPVFLAAVALFFVLAARPDLLRRLVRAVSRLLPARLHEIINRVADDFLAGLGCLRTPADLAGMVGASYASWLAQGVVYWVVSTAFALEIGFPVALLVVGVVNLAGLIPASPGQLGVFEFFAAAVLVAAGVQEETAVAFALVVHAVVWLPATALGFYFLARQGLSASAIRRARLGPDRPLAARD